jgi:predicted nucleotidyltransferase
VNVNPEVVMNDLNLNQVIIERFKPFQDEILSGYKDNIHSITLTGSALTDDFVPGKSDINSVVVLMEMDLKFLELLATLGKKYQKKGIAAPLIMTPEYIVNSLDVFPIEFLNIKLLHNTIFGENLFQDLKINRSDLRLQCERELKVRLIGLRQGYISCLGNSKMLMDMFIDSFSGYIPLFKGIILLLGKEPPVTSRDVINVLEEVSGVPTSVFNKVLTQKKQKTKLMMGQLNTIFEEYYAAIERLGDITDGIKD